MFVRIDVSGVRSSCEASATSWRWESRERSSVASIVLNAAPRRSISSPSGLAGIRRREVVGVGDRLGLDGQAAHRRRSRRARRAARGRRPARCRRRRPAAARSAGGAAWRPPRSAAARRRACPRSGPSVTYARRCVPCRCMSRNAGGSALRSSVFVRMRRPDHGSGRRLALGDAARAAEAALRHPDHEALARVGQRQLRRRVAALDELHARHEPAQPLVDLRAQRVARLDVDDHRRGTIANATAAAAPAASRRLSVSVIRLPGAARSRRRGPCAAGAARRRPRSCGAGSRCRPRASSSDGPKS